MRASQSPDDVHANLVSEALRIAAERRTHLAALRAQGLSAAGAEALCNGAMRHAIRLSLERSQADRNVAQRPLSRRQMDKLMRIISRRRVFEGDLRKV